MNTEGLKKLDGTPYPAGESIDIAEDGSNSCAIFVSSLLVLNELVDSGHARVDSTEKDMLKNGWYKIEELKEGAVIVWAALKGTDGQDHTHMGIYIGNDLAISNDSRGAGVPTQHDVHCRGTTEGGRQIASIYWNDKLND